MKIRVLIDFVDFSVNRTRHVGEVFEVTEERFAVINAALPGFVEKFGKDVSEKAADDAENQGNAEADDAEGAENQEGSQEDAQDDVAPVDADEDKSEVVDKIPDSGNKIDEIRAYLKAQGIEYDAGMKKADLLALIK